MKAFTKIRLPEMPNFLVGAIILLLFISDRFLFNISLGPFPIRVYVHVAVFGFAVLLFGNKSFHIPKLLKPLVILYTIYVIWHFIVIFLNGDYQRMNIPAFFLSRYLTIAFTFFVLVTMIKKKSTFFLIFFSFFFVGFFNALIVCLQQFQVEAAWIIGDLASKDITYIGGGKYYFKQYQEYPPTVPIGLMGFVVTTGYFVCASAPMALYFFVKKKYIIFIPLVATFLLAAIFTQQRSALLLVFPIFLGGMYILSKKKKTVLVTLGFLLLPVLIQINTIAAYVVDKAFDNSDKFDQGLLEDGIRVYNYLHTLKFIGEYPLFGGVRNYYSLYPDGYLYKFTPHNVLLNAYVDAGIVGFILIFILIIVSFVQLKKTYTYYNKENEVIPLILFMCSIAFMLNSFLHSSGFTSGDNLFWWFAILGAVYPNILQNSKKHV